MSNPRTASAGLLLYRVRDGQLEVLIGHMGGPFWAKKDEGGWSIFKGEYQPEEDPLAAAYREFVEETGREAPPGPTIELGEVRQRSGKRIAAWAIEADFDASTVKSNTFSIEWPRGSGRMQDFPEIDRADWFDTTAARRKLVKGQVPFLESLERQVLGRVLE